LPKGASVVTASGVFDNFTPAIPEPPGWALLVVGFAALGLADYGRTQGRRRQSGRV
jgi:hypothetical protein